ncbi:MAG: zinc-dependent peptidase [Sandaracinus sp.]|nr:zinc-dependent peptidase [Sandaracinus sp.]MCB9631056.1 zinc-dependent peptidase [Sandaracinus sp.]
MSPLRRVLPTLVLGVAVCGGLAFLGAAQGAWWLVATSVAVAAGFTVVVARVPLRQMRALRGPFPEPWRRVLETHVRYYRRLDDEGRARFERNVLLLAATYDFEAVAGVTITDELRMLALAGAAVLLQGWDDVVLPGTRGIVLHPASFDESYGEGPHADIAGQVVRQGPILFAVSELRRGWASEQDGYNVAIHEFAHVLDLADGYADGKAGVLQWGPVLAEELERVRRGRSPLRDYAGTNEAELFAVATEVFFERPTTLRDKAPDVYEVLRDFYAQDPASEVARPRRTAPKPRGRRGRKRRALPSRGSHARKRS